MVEQTEKAFPKQPKVFLSSKISEKGKRPGKGGNRFWKKIGLGFKTPRKAISGLFGLLCLIGLVNQSFVFMFFYLTTAISTRDKSARDRALCDCCVCLFYSDLTLLSYEQCLLLL